MEQRGPNKIRGKLEFVRILLRVYHVEVRFGTPDV